MLLTDAHLRGPWEDGWRKVPVGGDARRRCERAREAAGGREAGRGGRTRIDTDRVALSQRCCTKIDTKPRHCRNCKGRRCATQIGRRT